MTPAERLELAQELLEGHAHDVDNRANSPRYQAKCEMAAFLLSLFQPHEPRAPTKFETGEVYMVDTTSLHTLENVKNVLYGDKPISGDGRRDLANAMDNAMHYVWPYDPPDRPGGDE